MNKVISFKAEFQDPRFLQIYLLGSFLIYGILFLGWSSRMMVFSAALVSTLTTQFIWTRVKGGDLNSLRSALISGLGLCLLLRVESPLIMALVGILTISSKFILRFKGKHIFNPTNFGIIIAVLSGLAWITPGQWGRGEVTILLIIIAAVGILTRVGRWDVSVSFIFSLLVLEVMRSHFYLGWDLSVVLHRLTSGTILLFAFFMITDPKTTPNSRKGRILWGALIALLSFILSGFFYLYQAPLIALFIISLTTPLVDRLYEAERFKWISKH